MCGNFIEYKNILNIFTEHALLLKEVGIDQCNIIGKKPSLLPNCLASE